MGAIQKNDVITGRTLEEAFERLQDADREEHGTDAYSGGWNNIHGVTEVSSKRFDEMVKNDEVSKHTPAIARCLRKPVVNKMKVKTSVTNYPNKGTRKWVTKYVGTNGFENREVVREESQALAIKKAREYVDKNPSERVDIHISKELQSASLVARVNYKPSKNEADGQWEVFGESSY